jgi:hypothetical protein
MKDEKIIARIPRDTNTEIVIRTATHWNIDIIDIRWYNNGNPTRKGVRFNKEEAINVIKALNMALTNRGMKDGHNNKNDETED